MERLLESGAAFDALVCASDLIALGAVQALKDRGRDVPGDVAVTGFDNIPAAAQTSPPLTTVQQNARAAGEALVDTLIARIENQAVAPELLPVELILRESS